MTPRSARPLRRRRAVALAPFALACLATLGACASDGSDDEASAKRIGTAAEEISSIDCSTSSAQGYVQGKPLSIEVVTVDKKPVEVDTANAYYVMAQAAARSGVGLSIVSGFRTMKEQQYLYGCYTNCNCNGCNLAAKPGYSNHQSGHALDLNTSSSGVYAWLEGHAAAYGFKRTVPSEIWHWEWWGGGPGGGPCAAARSGGDASAKEGTGTSDTPIAPPADDGDAGDGDGTGVADETDPNGGGLGDLPPLTSSDGCSVIAAHASSSGTRTAGAAAALLALGAALVARRRRRP